ncbi:SDR family oxidoreductase [Ideonella sp. B7]|uniref:SDR family oxidoreductase n=1 Tax=Ideonella benzenivorans TaxID=2831643 RepID=UPI001CED5CCB|nr:SDR family oxidoreductase [Ideonella benzenivorans]MCA6215797.1 SDR family oxidoreductase [Ideonella benzenivorans]
MKTPRVFITGGASGLGRALAECFAKEGASVCLGDVDATQGADTRQGLARHGWPVHFLHCDVTQEGDLRAAADWLQQHWGGVDIVVNNAGVAQMGGIADVGLADWQWIVDINLLGVVRGCKVFTPLFRRQGGGTFLNIASMAGMIHLPEAAAYNATKAAVVALSETLQLELEADRIRVSVACPAFFRSDLARHMRAATPAAERTTQRLVERARIGAEEVARAIHRGLMAGEAHILTHPEGRMAWRLKRWLPYRWYLATLRRRMARLQLRMQRPAGAA